MYMGKALYREYRPHTLAEVAGQPHITGALERSLKTDVISHAFLFTGPRGVGKTSVARILAYQVNGLPYDESSNHLDIIEIDAASNRGIEDVRELRDKVAVAPTSAKYKVYIIDEVHMLTTPAFNALLKTLEEPPAHVIFILATTEAHKVPETIISRTQHYAFRPISKESIRTHLRTIATSENISINDEALEVLATHGGGSFRDSIGLLDQVRHSGDTITADDVRSIFGIAPEQAIRTIIDSIATHDSAAVFTALTDICEQGITAASLAAQLAHTLREDMRKSTGSLSQRQSLDLLNNLISVAPSPNPDITLEVVLIGAALLEPMHTAKPVQSQPASAPKALSVKSPAPKATPKPSQPLRSAAEISAKPNTVKPSSVAKKVPKDSAFETIWQESLLEIKKTYHSLYGVLRMAEVDLHEEQISLTFRFKLHYAKVNDPNNKEIIANVITKLSGKSYPILCTLNESSDVSAKTPQPITPPSAPSEPQPGALSTISNIFGGGELLES